MILILISNQLSSKHINKLTCTCDVLWNKFQGLGMLFQLFTKRWNSKSSLNFFHFSPKTPHHKISTPKSIIYLRDGQVSHPKTPATDSSDNESQIYESWLGDSVTRWLGWLGWLGWLDAIMGLYTYTILAVFLYNICRCGDSVTLCYGRYMVDRLRSWKDFFF